MKHISWLVLLLVLGLSNMTYSQTTPAEKPAKKKTAKKAVVAQEAESSASENFDPENLKGKWAMGGTYLAGLGNITVRGWLEKNSAIDIYVGTWFSGIDGQDFSGNYVTKPNPNFDIGLGLRQIVSRPVECVHVELIQRLLFELHHSEYANTYADSINDYQQFSLYIGVGFEAFIPFWKSLSIEGDAGIAGNVWYTRNDRTYSNGSVSNRDGWGGSFTTQDNNTGLFNLAAHYYF